jgi:hypothetical protein
MGRTAEQRREYRKRPDVIERTKKWKEDHSEDIRLKRCSLWGRFKQRKFHAKRKNIEFSITFEWLQKQPLVCYYTGRLLTLNPNNYNTLSIDKIDNEKGYTFENTVLCCHMVNLAKNDMDINEFDQMCRDRVKMLEKFQPIGKAEGN